MLNKNKLLLLIPLFLTCSSYAVLPPNIKITEPNPYENLQMPQIPQQLEQPTQDFKKDEVQTDTIGTAAEQGYVDPKIKEKQIEMFEKLQRMNTPRQLGYQVNIPQPLNTVKNNKELKLWYINWKGLLVEKVGITNEKVDFEASRLSKEEFERWATDFLYYHYDGFKNQVRTIYDYTE